MSDTSKPMSKWNVTTEPRVIRRLGKLLEELGELTNVAARCLIQGLDEVDPGTWRKNRDRLKDELADVHAQVVMTVNALDMSWLDISNRSGEKQRQMVEWESLYIEENP